MFHRILVAIEDSELGKQVFQQAIALAKVTDACLLLLHVLPPPFGEGPEGKDHRILIGDQSPFLSQLAFQSGLQQWDALRQHGLQLLGSCCAQADDADISVELTQNSGAPGATICNLARIWQADLILMGHHQHKPIKTSVSHYVLDHAPCALMVAPGSLGSHGSQPTLAETMA